MSVNVSNVALVPSIKPAPDEQPEPETTPVRHSIDRSSIIIVRDYVLKKNKFYNEAKGILQKILECFGSHRKIKDPSSPFSVRLKRHPYSVDPENVTYFFKRLKKEETFHAHCLGKEFFEEVDNASLPMCLWLCVYDFLPQRYVHRAHYYKLLEKITFCNFLDGDLMGDPHYRHDHLDVILDKNFGKELEEISDIFNIIKYGVDFYQEIFNLIPKDFHSTDAMNAFISIISYVFFSLSEDPAFREEDVAERLANGDLLSGMKESYADVRALSLINDLHAYVLTLSNEGNEGKKRIYANKVFLEYKNAVSFESSRWYRERPTRTMSLSRCLTLSVVPPSEDKKSNKKTMNKSNNDILCINDKNSIPHEKNKKRFFTKCNIL